MVVKYIKSSRINTCDNHERFLPLFYYKNSEVSFSKLEIIRAILFFTFERKLTRFTLTGFLYYDITLNNYFKMKCNVSN